ncbi:type IV pilus modification protein PilV [Candidatus Endobugula sertula]|uniref:Type IV pilus modification protein PilV n=1 Tax=Candidatus Endobugula sertula TaxID=62101 RepID=A0A1D2QTI2_9GAMM|nr:type IV pilus modification protein PilV [Candidatus Endobugula sertula]
MAVNKNAYRQDGAGLIEVLVALVVLAVGLLGVLSMQARGIDSNQRAFFATDATVLAYDMADRILAFGSDGAGADGGSHGAISVNANTEEIECGDSCTAVQTDTNEWVEALDDIRLPSARADVEWADPVYTITIRWDQDRFGSLPANNTVAVDCANADTSQTLTCFQLEVSL